MQINNYLLIFLFIISITNPHSLHNIPKKNYLIILNPFGDGKRTGNAISNSFERAISLHYAEKLKLLIEEKIPYTQVVITRLPGDIVYDFQNASLSNRLCADLFISLHFYQSNQGKSTITLYTFSYGDNFSTASSDLMFHQYDQAYIINRSSSDKNAQLIKKNLINFNSHHNNPFIVDGPYKIPIKPLIGVIAPSIAIEIGIKNKESSNLLIEPVFYSIQEMIKNQDIK